MTPAGRHRAGYHWPRKGERRRQEKPLKIDRLPAEVREQIQALRAAGKTWEEIAEATHLPATTVHRWYDLRVAQVQREVMAQAERARQLIAAFAAKGFTSIPEAALNALSSEAFRAVEAGSLEERSKALSNLLFLAAKLTHAKVAEKRAALEEEKLALERQKFDRLRSAGQRAVEEIEQGKDPKQAVRRLREELGIKAPRGN